MKAPTMYVASQVWAEICLFNVVGGHFCSFGRYFENNYIPT